MTLRLPRRPPSLTGWRDAVIFCLGAWGAYVHFVANEGPLDPIRAAAICALLGLPFFLRSGESDPSASSPPPELPSPEDAPTGEQDGRP